MTKKKLKKRLNPYSNTIIRTVDVAKGFIIGLFSFVIVVNIGIIPGLGENVEKHSGLYTAVLATFAALIALEAARENIRFHERLRNQERSGAAMLFDFISTEIFSIAHSIREELNASNSDNTSAQIFKDNGITHERIEILYDTDFLSRLDHIKSVKAIGFRDAVAKALEFSNLKCARQINKDKIIDHCEAIMQAYGMPQSAMS